MASLITQDRLQVIEDTAKLCTNMCGHLAELGVFEGGSALVIAKANPKRLYLYDTFTGIPEDDQDKRGTHKKGDFATDIEKVKKNLSGYNVVFRPGLFPDTAVDCKYCFVHIDADTFQSTLQGIDYFWSRLVVDGYCLLDDFGWPQCPGVKRAAEQVLRRVPRRFWEQTAPYQMRVQKCDDSFLYSLPR